MGSRLFILISTVANAQQSRRPFTVADDIGFSHFISDYDAYCCPRGIAGAYHNIMSAEFVEGDKNRVEINFSDRHEVAGTIEYRRAPRGEWELVSERRKSMARSATGWKSM